MYLVVAFQFGRQWGVEAFMPNRFIKQKPKRRKRRRAKEGPHNRLQYGHSISISQRETNEPQSYPHPNVRLHILSQPSLHHVACFFSISFLFRYHMAFPFCTDDES